MNVQKALPDLGQFTGSETWYRHGLVPGVVYTEGVRYVVEKAGAHWLIDKIATLQMDPVVAHNPFQVWKLEITEGVQGATLTMEDGDNNKVYTEDIDFTDFPEPGITLWFTDKTILLPGEY